MQSFGALISSALFVSAVSTYIYVKYYVNFFLIVRLGVMSKFQWTTYLFVAFFGLCLVAIGIWLIVGIWRSVWNCLTSQRRSAIRRVLGGIVATIAVLPPAVLLVFLFAQPLMENLQSHEIPTLMAYKVELSEDKVWRWYSRVS